VLAEVIKLYLGDTAVLRADKGVAHERILQVLDLCNGAGVSSVGFGVLPTAKQTAPQPHT